MVRPIFCIVGWYGAAVGSLTLLHPSEPQQMPWSLVPLRNEEVLLRELGELGTQYKVSSSSCFLGFVVVNVR